MMRKLLLLGTVLAAGLSSHAALAVPVTGTEAITLFGVGVSGNGTNLLGATSITNGGSGVTTSVGGSGLSGIPQGTSITGVTTLFPTTGTPAFSMTIGTFGTFTETSAPDLIGMNSGTTTENAEYYILGTFTPAGALSSFSAGPASLDIGFTETIGTDSIIYSASGTFASPPTPLTVPEPASLALFGTGVLGLGLLRRRKSS